MFNETDAKLIELISIDPNAIPLFKKNPKWVFRYGNPNPFELIGDLVRQVFALGCEDIRIIQIEDWYVIGSDQDWMTIGTTCDPIDQFTSVIGLPELGENQARQEVAIAAFAKAVAIYKNAERTIILSDIDSHIDERIRILNYSRILAFKW
jgi:hypothetical protein